MMEWFVRAFLKSALVALGLGVVMGTWIALDPAAIVYRPAHAHLNLLGFVSMVIYGVAYHVIPRFSGNPLHSRTIAGAQWWIANAGLALMVIGFLLAPGSPTVGRPVLGVGALASATAAGLFIYNLWRTLDGRGPKPKPTSPSARSLPMQG